MANYGEKLIGRQDFYTTRGTDVATSGAINNLANTGTSFFRLTAATSLTGLVADLSGKELIITNANTADLLIANDSASSSAGNKILTGTGGNITLSAGASLLFKYDDAVSYWRVVGGVAGGFSVSAAAQSIGSGGTITLGAGFFQTITVVGNSGAQTASTTPFGATPPLTGTVINLIGTDNTNTVTLTANDAANGCVLSGDIELGKYTSIQLQYVGTLARYVEISRNNVGGY